MTDPAFFPPVPSPAVQTEGQGVVGADQFNTFLSTVTNLDQLRTFPGIHNMMCLVQGTNEAGDGGATIYWYDMFNVSMDNNSSVIRPTGTVQGRWIKSGALQFQHPHTMSAASGVFTLTGSNTTVTYNIYVFDDSCHVFFTTNTGATWSEIRTPNSPSTLLDFWSDFMMSINDANYTDMILLNTNVYQGNQGGILKGVTSNMTGFETATPLSYKAAFNAGSGTDSGQAGAFSGSRILIAIDQWDGGVLSAYPRLSTDGGSTWNDVTGLPVNQAWLGAAFNTGGAIEYIHEATGHIYKSTDSGMSWSVLSASPTFAHAGGIQDSNTYRLRCNTTGNIVSVVGAAGGFSAEQGQFNYSSDGGTTWTQTDFASLAGDIQSNTIYACDFGMKPDGTKLVAIVSGINVNTGFQQGWMFTSPDGNTWTQRSPPSNGGVSFNRSMLSVNMSPDGDCIAVVYDHDSETIGRVDISTDSGATWTAVTFSFQNPGGAEGGWVSLYVTQ